APNAFDLLKIVAQGHRRVAVVLTGLTPAAAPLAVDGVEVTSLPANVATTDLLATIRRAHRGNDLPAQPPSIDAVARLSHREHQVLCMIGRGFRVRDIANELALSEKTVSTYRARVLDKLALTTTAQLIRYAIQNHLVD